MEQTMFEIESTCTPKGINDTFTSLCAHPYIYFEQTRGFIKYESDSGWQQIIRSFGVDASIDSNQSAMTGLISRTLINYF